MSNHKILVIVLAAIAVFILATTASGCSFVPPGLLGGLDDSATSTTGTGTNGSSISGASGITTLAEGKTCTDPVEKECPEDERVFSPRDPEISFTAVVNNVKAGTLVVVEWKYLGGDPDVAPFNINTEQVRADTDESSRPFISTISKIDPDKDWAYGDYQVKLSLPEIGSPPLQKKFRVE